MEALFLKILNMSITAGYVIFALLFIRLLLKGAPKKYSYLLWSVVLFRLICPVSFSSIFSIFQTEPFDMTMAQSGGAAALTYVPADIGYMNAPRVTVGIPSMNSVISESLPAATPYASVNPMQIWILLGTILWCIGIAALLVYNIVTYIRLKHRMATAVCLKGNVCESDKTRSPFILGFFKPLIYIPFGLGQQERGYIIQHEEVHLRRKDHWIKLLSLCVLAVHWFNPLVWLAYALMTKDMEMSCDEKVLSESNVNIIHEYSMSLLSFAANRRFPAASPLAFGEAGVRERIKNVLRFKKPPRRVVIFAVIICITSVAACAANPKQLRETKESSVKGQMQREGIKEEQLQYGNYAFEKQIYMNPLSSFIASNDYKEYYTLDENSLTVIDEAGSQRKFAIAYKKTQVDEQEFKTNFLIEGFNIPDISSYKECYQLTDDSGSSGYRIYQMDEEFWLVRLRRGDASDQKKSDYIWSIYKIAGNYGETPLKASISGYQNGVEEFLLLQGNFQSGYDADTCYNITPENIKQKSDYQVFKYNASSASFLLYEGNIHPLGEWFGGLGVTSMALADLDGDGKQELYFTYSWGSGIHRSHAAYFDPTDKQIIKFEYMHLNEDMMIAVNSDGEPSLYTAVISDLKDFVNFDIKKANYISDIVYQDGKILLSQASKE